MPLTAVHCVWCRSTASLAVVQKASTGALLPRWPHRRSRHRIPNGLGRVAVQSVVRPCALARHRVARWESTEQSTLCSSHRGFGSTAEAVCAGSLSILIAHQTCCSCCRFHPTVQLAAQSALLAEMRRAASDPPSNPPDKIEPLFDWLM